MRQDRYQQINGPKNIYIFFALFGLQINRGRWMERQNRTSVNHLFLIIFDFVYIIVPLLLL